MLIPVGYAQVNLRFTGISVPLGAEVAFGIDVTGAPGGPVAVATLVNDAVGDSGIMSNLASDVSLTEIAVKEGPNSTGPSAEITVAHGGTAGAALAPNSAFLIKKVTAIGGRAGRGRSFWPVPADADVGAGGIILDTPRTALQTDATAFLEALDTNAVPMVLLHDAASPIATPTPVVSYVVDVKVATQRRRLRK